MGSVAIDEDAGNVLVTTDDVETCTECMDGGDPDRRAELTVTYPSESTEDGGVGDHGRTQPARKGLISVGDSTRSTTAPQDAGPDFTGAVAQDAGPDFTGAVAQDAIADPTNLQRLGTSVSEFCQRWDDGNYDIYVCFDSLSALLEYTPPEVVFQFCHVLTTRLTSVDATAHFHLDPGRHADETVATFQSIFDQVIGQETQAATMDVDYEEATDDDIAALAEDWSEEASYSIVGEADDRPDDVTEATDDDVEKTLDDRL